MPADIGRYPQISEDARRYLKMPTDIGRNWQIFNIDLGLGHTNLNETTDDRFILFGYGGTVWFLKFFV